MSCNSIEITNTLWEGIKESRNLGSDKAYSLISESIKILGLSAWTQNKEFHCNMLGCGCVSSNCPLSSLLNGQENTCNVNIPLIKQLIDNNILTPEQFRGSILIKKLKSACGWKENFDLINYLLTVIPPNIWIEARDKNGFTCLHALLDNCGRTKIEIEIFEKLINIGCDPTVKSKFGTIENYLIYDSFYKQIKFCVEKKGLNINECQHTERNTPSFIGMCYNFSYSKTLKDFASVFQTTMLLQKHGYDFTQCDENGNTCYDAIVHYGMNEILGFVIPKDQLIKKWVYSKYSKDDKETGFEKNAKERYDWYTKNSTKDLSYLEYDNDIHLLMLRLRGNKYCKNLKIIEDTKRNIVNIFTPLPDSYKKQIHATLHNQNNCMYGYMYLEDLKYLFPENL